MAIHDVDEMQAAPARAREERPAMEHPAVGVRERRLDVLGAHGVLRLQRTAGNAAVSGLVEEERSPVLDVVAGGGTPLAAPVRADMERRLGGDFGDVRVHTDAAAHDSAKSVGAHAYTVGAHVVFQRDAYDPGSAAGGLTLAHELTHVMQQRSGPVEGTPTGGGVSVSHPSDRFEQAASDNAARAMSAPAPAAVSDVQRTPDGAALQREDDPDEEPDAAAVQGAFVQRQEEDEEESAEG